MVALDTDEQRIAGLRDGVLPFFEPGLEEIFEQAQARGLLHFTTDPADLADAEVHFLCVGTPQSADGRHTDTSYVEAAASRLAPYLSRDALVVGKSTVPVGTANALAARLRNLTGREVRLAWSPEFVRQGRCVHDTLEPDRIVYGVGGSRANDDIAVLDEIFAPQYAAGADRVVVDYATAELVKAAANAYLATKISFINAVAELCEASGADALALADAIGLDRRIGRDFLSPGLGFGGGCLPKDLNGLGARAEEYDAARPAALLREVDAINDKARTNVVELALDLCDGDLYGKRVAILGAAFKPHTDDVRDSPALDVASICRALGAQVVVHDPIALDNARRAHPELSYRDNVLDACNKADVVLHLTEWPQYAELDPAQLATVVGRACIVDGRHGLDPDRWSDAGWRYRAFGRPLAATAIDSGQILGQEAL
ncbi:UDP-glucose/GDP-mannose dehydrogenase family protein [Epidermidibacterium keratini]